MTRIGSTTPSAKLLEYLFLINELEQERIVLYPFLKTNNKIQIDVDFNSRVISISAILPIDSVDANNLPIFPVAPSGRWVVTEVIDNTEENEDIRVFTITIVREFVPDPLSQSAKSVQFQIDVENKQAIVSAILPFNVGLLPNGSMSILALE